MRRREPTSDHALRAAVGDAFANFVDVIADESSARKAPRERMAAFMVARAVYGAEDDEPRETCPVERPVWQRCAPLIASWRIRLGEFADSSTDAAGAVYQYCLTAASRKREGVFYTPDLMAQLLAEEAIKRLPSDKPPLVLDPACGSGRFLIAAYRLIQERWGLSAEDALTRLRGVELDPFAAALTRLALLREAGLPLDRVDAARIVEAHALLPRAQQTGQLSLGFEADDDAERPDLVVGNPPYGARVTDKEAERYREQYELAAGRFDVVSLFVELGGRALREGGVLAYVLPHAFTRSGGYAATREWLTAHGSVAALVNIGRDFPEIDLDTCALLWRKGPGDATATGFEARGHRLVRVGEVESGFYRGRRVWPIYITKQNVELAMHLEGGDSQPLESLAKIRRGATIKGMSKLMQGLEPGDGVPVVRGRNVKPYANIAEMPLGCVDEADLPDEARRFITTERTLVVQNIGDRLKATLCPAGVLPIDTVNVFHVRDPGLMCYLAAYLNSALVGRYVRDMILNRATLTVHFDAPTIGNLPVRVPGPVDLDYFDRVVPMLIDEPDPDTLGEVEARVCEICEVGRV